MAKYKKLVPGDIVGRLELIRKYSIRLKDCSIRTKWECRCSCGEKHDVLTVSLNRGEVSSCGCLGRSMFIGNRRTHGLSRGIHKRAYDAWLNAKRRCINPKVLYYERYGGRGIKMCERWLNSPANFLADMGDPPVGTTLERKNNNGDYYPENCTWASRKEQANNRSTNTMITYDGVSLSLKTWAAVKGKNYHTLLARLAGGVIDPEELFA